MTAPAELPDLDQAERDWAKDNPAPDALIAAINAFLADAPKGKPHTGYRYGELLEQAAAALAAQAQRIAELEQHNATLLRVSVSAEKSVREAEAALRQAVPREPTAWMYESEHSCAGPFTERRVTFSIDRWGAVPHGYIESPLYAAPADAKGEGT